MAQHAEDVRDLVLLGAGASYGSLGVQDLPPLGKDLFAHLTRFSDVWRALPEEIAKRFRRDGLFEPGFAYIRSQGMTNLLSPLLRAMGQFFLQFEPAPGNLYWRLAQQARSHVADVVWATLNYDLLFDLALGEMSHNLGPECRGASLLRVHGAPNFLPDMGGTTFMGTRLGPIRSGGSIFAGPLRILHPAKARAELARTRLTNELMVPAMALYAPGKEVMFCADEIRELQARFADCCRTAARIWIVGVRLSEDPHIWNPIVEGHAAVHWFNPDTDDTAKFSAWAAERRINVAELGGTMADFVGRFCA